MRIWSSSRIDNPDSPLRKTVTVEFEAHEAIVINAALESLLHDEIIVTTMKEDESIFGETFLLVASIMHDSINSRLITMGVINGDVT